MSSKQNKVFLPKESIARLFLADTEFTENITRYSGPSTDENGVLVFKEQGVETDETEDFVGENQIVDVEQDGSLGLTCLICKVKFDSRDAQREHYMLDWHRFNAKQKVLCKPPVTEEEFECEISGELSSISGSDTEEEDDLHPSSSSKDSFQDDHSSQSDKQCDFFTKHPTKAFFVTRNDTLFSIQKNIDNETDNKGCLNLGTVWVYLMFNAGHFAGAVFNKETVLVHKTFHRYTVRAKRGTSQSARDNKGSGHIRSYGAQLRRHNEAALNQDIQDLLVSWSNHLQSADKIFYKCPPSHISVLFNDKTMLKKVDKRVVKISGITRRPTLNEVKRIHGLNCIMEIHGSTTALHESFKSNTSNQPLKTHVITVKDDVSDVTIPPPKKGTHLKVKDTKKKDKQVQPKSAENPDSKLWMWGTIHEWCSNNNLQDIKTFFQELNEKCENGDEESLNSKNNFMTSSLNYLSKSKNQTLLHVAVATGNREMVAYFLKLGADPTIGNNTGQLPYELSNKAVRNEFRRFRSDHPDMYDYSKTKIDSPLTALEEENKKKKDNEKKRKAQKEKLKKKKAEEREQKLVEKEKQDFEKLSDREKRAVMAERRFASQLTNSLRCAHCRSSITEKDAFERLEYKYCTTNCVFEHKKVIGK